MHDVVSALECVGLDPAVGFLHRDRPGRPSLALDLMEELRTWLADRFVLSLINLRQISAGDFHVMENEAVVLNDDGRAKLLIAYQKRKQEELMHPFLDEKVTFRTCRPSSWLAIFAEISMPIRRLSGSERPP
jgi:CRISPR-associated protein Cas1